MATTVTESLNASVERSSNYEEEFHDMMPEWGYVVAAFVLFLIGFFGFFLNLLVIILMCKDRQLWTPLNVILFNLVCSDFSVSILGNPFTLISAIHHRWIFGKTMCIVYGFFMTLLGITSITTLTVLSFERYMMISKPLTTHRLSMKSATWAVCCIWCFSFAVTTPPLFGWGSYVSEGANISCSINWEEQTTNALTYILFLFAMGLVLPVFIITFSYMNILKTMKSNSCRMGRVAKAESQVTIMVFLMIVTFMVAWTPYSILALIEQFAARDLISPGLGVVPALVAKSSICYDPIIYVGMNTQFRSSVKRIFGYVDRDDSVNNRALENTISVGKSQFKNDVSNATLGNPNNNIALAVYKDVSSKYENCKQIKSKIFIETTTINMKGEAIPADYSGEVESSDVSADKDAAQTDNSKYEFNFGICDEIDDEISMIPSNSTKNPFENMQSIDFGTKYTRNKKTKNKFVENDEDMFESKELLVGKKFENQFEGFDNMASNMWEGKNLKRISSTNPTNERFDLLNEVNVPARRKSIANTNLMQFSDTRTTKKTSILHRRKSGSVISSYSRKFPTTLHNVKGVTISKLMVDERDRSKMLPLNSDFL